MNGKDLLDIMGQVDDDLILKTEVKPEDKAVISPVPARKAPVRRPWIGVVAGLCAAAVVCIGVAAWKTNWFGLVHEPTNTMDISTTEPTPESTIVTTTPPESTAAWTPTPTPTPAPTEVTTLPEESTDLTRPHQSIDPDQVLYAPDIKTGNVPDDFESPATDEIQMPASLEEEFSKPENRDKYFAVSINISHFACVDEYLSGHKPFIPQEELIEKFADEIRTEAHEEIDRLTGLGYDIYLLPSYENEKDPYCVFDGHEDQYRYHIYHGYTVSGYMTGEQLASFRTNSAYGYRFTWDSKETHIDKSEI